jgi:adenosylhomocysteine nucleosidase
MILVIATSKDDVLYLESKMRNKKYEKFTDKCIYFTGIIVGQEICVAYGISTNYMSSVLATYLIEKYNAPVVINVGMARSFTSDLKIGDVFISRDICIADVNLANCERVKLSEIPNMPEMFIGDIYLVNLLNNVGTKFFNTNLKSGTLISSNNYYESIDDLIKLNISDGTEVLGKTKNLALDTEAGGIAVACNLLKVPFVSVKIIQYNIHNDVFSKDNMIKALKMYPSVGKLVTAIIAEISSNVTVTIKG